LSSPDSQIFYDPRGRRWKRVRRTWLALGVAATALATVFIVSVLVQPALPPLNLRQSAHIPHAVDARTQVMTPPSTPAEAKARDAADELKQTLRTTKVVPARRPSQIKVTPPPADAQAQHATNVAQAQAASNPAQAQAAKVDGQSQALTPASERPAAVTQDDDRSQAAQVSNLQVTNTQSAQASVPAGRPLAVGFYVNWDD